MIQINQTDFKLVSDWAKNNDVYLYSISFYQDLDGKQDDSEFTYCDLTGQKTMTAKCMARTVDGSILEFNASETLVGGALGKLAGAF